MRVTTKGKNQFSQLEVSAFAWENRLDGLDVVVDRMIESAVEKNRRQRQGHTPRSQSMIVFSTIATRRLSVGAIATNI